MARCHSNRSAMSGNMQRGFTLTELLITVAVLSILIGIAVPSYQQFVIRGKRSAAQAVMMDIANREQQYLLANRTYADKATLESNGFSLPADVRENYTWDIALGTGPMPSFVITFTGTGAQAEDNSPQPLTLSSSGEKAPPEKWKR
jgi:type IV pilus assembly protein PilE